MKSVDLTIVCLIIAVTMAVIVAVDDHITKQETLYFRGTMDMVFQRKEFSYRDPETTVPFPPKERINE